MNNILNVEYVDIQNIKIYASNAKMHDDKQIQQIAKSIEQFGFNNPLLVDENYELIAGHGRLEAAKLLKMSSVPIIRLTHLSSAEKKAYRIADNKLTENGRWNEDLLKLEFSEIEKLCFDTNEDFSLDITGFSMPEIDLIIQGAPKPSKIDAELNSLPYVPEDELISEPGDVWLLGSHRIICGDSLKAETFDTLMQGKKASMIFTDPPYDLPVKNICGQGKIKHKEFAFASGEMNEQEFVDFLKNSMKNLAENSVSGSVHYICMDWRHILEIVTASKSVYEKMLNLVVWCKQNGGMGSFYRSQHELIFVFQKGKASHINNVELGKHGRYRTNVWNYAGVNSFGHNQACLKLHPTVKPVEMIEDAILDASKRGDLILDAFLGSGSTLMAAEKTHRICYGVEYEPLYIDTIIRRYFSLTGIWAVHGSTGLTYDQILQERKEKKNDRI